MNRRSILRWIAAAPVALIPGCFAPGLPAAVVVPHHQFFAPQDSFVDYSVDVARDYEGNRFPEPEQLFNGFVVKYENVRLISTKEQ